MRLQDLQPRVNPRGGRSHRRAKLPATVPDPFKQWEEAAEAFLNHFFPQCRHAAMVVEPGWPLPPLVVPVCGDIPGCIDAIGWMVMTANCPVC
jgi:hypothetical protein